MLKIKNTSLWQCDLTLQDYLYFATVTRGRMIETGQFIHNYSLTYALGWARSEWRQERKEPLYAEQLGNVKGIYVTPARLLTENHTIVPYRAETESYASSAIPDSNPRSYRTIKCFGPGSVFRFYILTRSDLDKIPPLIRLGKYMAKAEIAKQRPVELEIVEGNYIASTLLNWDDIAVRPILCDVIVYALPGRLIENARFSSTRYLRAKFASGEEEVRLPLEMGYLRKELCSSWWDENAA
jgi:CRISPR-associated protein Csc1